MKIVLGSIIVVVGLYLFFIVFPAIVAAIIVFSPQKYFYKDFSELEYKYKKYYDALKINFEFFENKNEEKLFIKGYDNTKLQCGYYANGNSDKLAVFFHGYRATPFLNCASQAKFFFENGYNVAFVYERSHNNLAGRHIGLGSIEKHDVVSWCEYFKKNTDNSCAIFYGVSMGSTALALACDRLPEDFVKGLIFDCGFISTYEQIKRECNQRKLPTSLMMPYVSLVAKIILHEDIADSTCNHLSKCNILKLFIHGKSDSMVDAESSVTAYNSALPPKKLLLIENAKHALAFLEDTETVKEKISSNIMGL